MSVTVRKVGEQPEDPPWFKKLNDLSYRLSMLMNFPEPGVAQWNIAVGKVWEEIARFWEERNKGC